MKSRCVSSVYQRTVRDADKLHFQHLDCIAETCLLLKEEEAMNQACQVDAIPKRALRPMVATGAGDKDPEINKGTKLVTWIGL
jgi:hypothetical protein